MAVPVSDLFRYLVLLFPALGHFGSSQRIPFSASFSFVSVVLLHLLFGLCFLLWGFPRCTSSWLSCSCSSVRSLASSLPVPRVIGFPVGLWALLCLSRISGSLRDGVLPLGRGSCILVFLRSSFLVLHMPFFFFFFSLLCVGRSLLLSFYSSCLTPLFRGSFLLGGPSSSSAVGFFRLRFRSPYLLHLMVFPSGCLTLVFLLLSSQFPLPSSGSSLVLFWSPSIPSFYPYSSCLGWVPFLYVCSP